MLASVTVLGALSIIGLSGLFLSYTKITQLSDDAHNLELANRQQIMSETLLHFTEYSASDADEINDTVAQLWKSHEELLQGPKISDNTRSLLKSLTPALQNLTELAGSKPSLIASKELADSSSEYHAGMIRATSSLKRDYTKHQDSIISTQVWILSASIVLLGGTLLLIVGPIRRHLFSALSELENSRDEISEHVRELDDLRKKLEKAHEELETRHDSLRLAYAETTSVNDYLTLASLRFEELFHGVPFACFSVDSDGIVYDWNEAASQLFDTPGHRIIQKSIYSEIFGLQNDEVIHGLISEAFTGKKVTNVEMNISRKKSTRQLIVSVFPVRASGNDTTAVLIACANITKQKDAEFEALRANRKVESILESIQDAFVTLDTNLVYKYANSTATELMEADPDKIVGYHLTEVAKGWEESGLVTMIERSVKTGDSQMFDHYFLETETWYEFRIYPSEEGVSVFYNNVTKRKDAETLILEQREQLQQAMDKISTDSVLLEKQRLELEVANKHLQELAITDGLTGLLNHRAMQDELTLAISRAVRLDENLSYALLDADLFKRFNDEFGHQAGDEVLKAVAKVLSASVRDIDVVARYGGEEFCVILPGTDCETALIACERMRIAIDESELSGHHVTASFGVATYIEGESSVDLISRADQALYAAKASGRNKVCSWEPPFSASA